MKQIFNKLFACVLALALMLTGFGGPVAMIANAAVDDTSITFKVVDKSNNPVSGLTLNLVDPEGEEDPLESITTNGEGIATYEMDNGEMDIVYELKTEDGSEYTVDPSVKVGIGHKGSDMYIDTVNGSAFSGETVNVTVKKEAGEEPSEDPTPSEDGWTVADFTFDEAGTTVTGLTDSGKAKLMKDPALEIPDTNDGKDIIGIGAGKAGTGNGVFVFTVDEKRYEPTSVKLPAKLETIGNFAFATAAGKDQNGITSLELPETVKTIGLSAFQNATFTEVVIPDSVTSLGNGAFAGNQGNPVKIQKMTLPSGITAIPNALFNSQNIETVIIPEGVKSVGTDAFTGNYIKTLSLPSTLETIGTRSFQNHALSELVLPDSVKSIGNYAFKVSQETLGAKLENITLNEGLTSIGKEAFTGNPIKEAVLPTTVTTLNKDAFKGCSGTVTLKSSVEDQANAAGDYTKVVTNGSGHKVVYEAPAPAKTNVLKVKVVDEEGNPVSKIKLYFDEKSDSFTADENGVATYTVGQYVTKGSVGVDTEGYAVADKNLEVVCSGSPAMIDTVNGEAYDGEQGVVLKVKTVAVRKTTATVKLKTVDSEGNPVGNVKLYSNESVYNYDTYEQEDKGEFATGADGLYDYTLDKYTTGTVRIKVTDEKHSSDQVVVIKCGSKSYERFADTVDGKEYSEGDVIEIVVKNEEPTPETTNKTTLKLKVVDQDGKAVEGVKVVLTAKENSDVMDPITLATSDANGETTFNSLEEEIQPLWLDDYIVSIESNDNYSYEGSDVVTIEYDRDKDEYFVGSFNGEAYDGSVKTITVKATAKEPDPEPVAKNVLKVKTVDENGDVVPNVQLYCGDEAFAFTTGEDGIGTYTLGTYQTGDKEVNVKAGTGYAAVSPILVTGTMDWTTYTAYISKVNGNAYNGEVVELVVKKGEVTPQPVKTSVLKVKTVDEQGNVVPNVKLYFDETYQNFITGEDGIGTFTIGQYQSGTVFVGVADSNYSSDAIIKVTCNVSYSTSPIQATIDKVNDVAYDGEPVELVVKSNKPAFDPTTLKVKVVDKDGNPVSGVELILKAKGAKEGLAFRGATDAEGMTEYKCQGSADEDVELSDYPYEVLLKDETTYKANNKPVVVFEEDDDWNTSFSEVNDETYTGQIVTITVENNVPSEPKDYYDEFTVTPGEKVEGATPITYNYTDLSDYPNTKTVTSNVNLYTIRVPEDAEEVKIDFNGNERIAYGYHNYDNKDGYDSYVNSCAADAVKGYKDNGAVGETTGTIRRNGGKFPEYVFVQTPYATGSSEDLYVIKVEVYPVDRIEGATRYDTALNVADRYMAETRVDSLGAIIVTNGENFPDALAGGYLAKEKKAPIVIVNEKTESKIQDYIKAKVKDGGDVYLLGGTLAISNNFESALKSDGYNVKRLGGATRYDTNIAILKEAGVTSQELLVCTGDNFADSLSASAAGRPIFIVGKTLTASQKQYLGEITPYKVYAIGGTGVVNEKVLKAVGTATKTTPERIAGSTRYATSVEVAKKLVSENPKTVIVTTGKNFPDGLAGGPLAYKLDAPLILVGPTDADNAAAVEYCKNAKVSRSIALGGEGVVSEAVRTGMLTK